MKNNLKTILSSKQRIIILITKFTITIILALIYKRPVLALLEQLEYNIYWSCPIMGVISAIIILFVQCFHGEHKFSLLEFLKWTVHNAIVFLAIRYFIEQVIQTNSILDVVALSGIWDIRNHMQPTSRNTNVQHPGQLVPYGTQLNNNQQTTSNAGASVSNAGASAPNPAASVSSAGASASNAGAAASNTRQVIRPRDLHLLLNPVSVNHYTSHASRTDLIPTTNPLVTYPVTFYPVRSVFDVDSLIVDTYTLTFDWGLAPDASDYQDTRPFVNAITASAQHIDPNVRARAYHVGDVCERVMNFVSNNLSLIRVLRDGSSSTVPHNANYTMNIWNRAGITPRAANRYDALIMRQNKYKMIRLSQFANCTLQDQTFVVRNNQLAHDLAKDISAIEQEVQRLEYLREQLQIALRRGQAFNPPSMLSDAERARIMLDRMASYLGIWQRMRNTR